MSTPHPQPDASRVYRRYLSAVLLHAHASARACGLGATDLYALNVLELAGSMTPGELGTRVGLTTGPTTRLVDRLEEAGYVRRVPSPDDRRKVIVEPVGRPAELDHVMADARRRIGELLGGYSPEQRATLFDYFTRAAEAYQDTAEDLRAGGGTAG
ncbi:MarR family winged helix-turn-helix transcriptional regulator [Streptomyces sp. NPDC001777]|uniref:MarR family winged helix-turn-helix transcriptional regulator n=1 Tax=Streptomyces sp. NPDC001777 TaxID=3364608 RepID=UPI0036A75B9B